MDQQGIQPRSLLDVEIIRPIMRQIHQGKAPHEIKTRNENQDVGDTIDKLVAAGLVDHLTFVAASLKQVQPGTYFLTDKGLRWLRTYGWRERKTHALSKFQVIWGVVLGVLINMTSNFLWPFVSPFLDRF